MILRTLGLVITKKKNPQNDRWENENDYHLN